MEPERLKPDIEIDESPDLHRTAWRLQPFAWVLIYSFVLLGLLGVFGNGWLSRRDLVQEGATVAYEAALRQGAVSALEFHDLSGSTQTLVSIPLAYLSRFSISSIVPEPSQATTVGDRVNYIFPGSSNDKQITFYLQPEKTGRLCSVFMVNGDVFSITHQIFP